MTASRSPHASPGRRALDLVTGSRAAQAYLLVVLALLAWVAVDTALAHQEDASFAGIFPVLATLPWGLAVGLLPDGSPLGYYPVIVAAALVNAGLLGTVTRRSSAGGRQRAPGSQ